MKKNMGKADRILRVLAAVVIISLLLAHIISGTWGYILLGVAGIFLLTGFISICPLYAIFGISTLKNGKTGNP